jgi:hypothetical protein
MFTIQHSVMFTVCRLMIGQYVSVFGDVISHVNMTSVRAEDGGEYACVAENRAGTDSHAARLNVYGKYYYLFINSNIIQ